MALSSSRTISQEKKGRLGTFFEKLVRICPEKVFALFRAHFSGLGSKSLSHRCQCVYLVLVVVISAALVVVVIGTPIAPIHCFDYDNDNDRECDPDNELGLFSSRPQPAGGCHAWQDASTAGWRRGHSSVQVISRFFNNAAIATRIVPGKPLFSCRSLRKDPGEGHRTRTPIAYRSPFHLQVVLGPSSIMKTAASLCQNWLR